jgi:hypothetical protein
MGVFAGANTGLNSDYHIHVYTSSGTFTPTFTGTVEVLSVGGGGGGGMDMGGGGGGGGVVSHTSYSVTAGVPITVTVGAGGAGGPSGIGYYSLNNVQFPWPSTGGQPGSHQFTVGASPGSNSSLGVNLISDGNFRSGIAGWGGYNSSISYHNSNSLRSVSSSGNPAGVIYYFSTVVGQVYYYKATVSQSGAITNDARIQISGIGLINSTGQSTTSETKTIYDSFTATSTTHILEILLYNSQSGAILTIDDVEVYPVSSSIVSYGGGLGGSSYFGYTPNYGYGGIGGSGGGASGYSDGNTGRGAAVRTNITGGGTGYGNAGAGSIGQYYAGGGGGAGGAGSVNPGNGGPGILNRILGQDYYWAGGGGGAGHSGAAGTGGIGGGGGSAPWGGGAGSGAAGGAGYKDGYRGADGYANYQGAPGGDAGANTGGGGGGGSHYNLNNKGGNGGSGVVIIRYPRSSGSYSSTNQGTFTNSSMILGLDAGNRKSWGGIGEERAQGILPTFGNWNGLTGTSVAYTPQTGRNGKGVYLNITAANGGGVNWWYSARGQMPCLSSTQYIISAKIKYVNTPSVNLFYVRQQNSGGSQTSESGKYTSGQQIDIGNGYYLAWAIFTTDSTATSFYVHGYEYQNNQIWLEDLQVKQYGIADLSPMGNDYNIVGSPAFTPGAFTFNDSISFTRSGRLKGASSNCSIVMLYKTTDTQELWVQGNTTSFYVSASSSNNYYHGGAGSPTNFVDLATVVRPDSPVNYKNGAYHMWEAKNVDLANGNFDSTSWFGYPSGWQLSNGTVVAIYVFNKTLSAAESAQLFYSFRGRLGI